MQPFASQVSFSTGVISPSGKVTDRRLSDMRGMYLDTAEYDRIMGQEGDRLVYQVYPVSLPEEPGQVLHCTTILHPGKVGDEYHMTKGHYHQLRDRAEVYLGLAGRGYLVLQLEDGTVEKVLMEPGTAAYVPPNWAHRTCNVGTEPFIFFAAWPGDSGHDYGTIEKLGFAQLLVDRGGQPTLVPNPRYGKG
jgi:glucose-6-phosphate isomerase